ncbi:MAG: hypothetical protein BWY95_00452 [Bacteroidetes bacterium ADurb.BinA104]|nr:MAG: hypothetical protein BWY95_00452 [Bacteroidetes bacterium ADurb.BinA104]
MTHNLPLQKDLEILREEVNRPSGRFEYMLFHKNQHVATRKHNREMFFGAVICNNGDIRLDSLRPNQGAFEPYIIEDNHAFIVPVTIRS